MRRRKRIKLFALPTTFAASRNRNKHQAIRHTMRISYDPFGSFMYFFASVCVKNKLREEVRKIVREIDWRRINGTHTLRGNEG